MEDVTDVVFRRLCRKHGATIAMTEFVNTEGLLRGCRNARRKIELADDDELTGIQIYGSNPGRLASRNTRPRSSSTSIAAAGSPRSPGGVRGPVGCAIPLRWWRWRVKR